MAYTVDLALLGMAGVWLHMRSVHAPTLMYAPTNENYRRVAALPHLTRSYWPFAPSSSWWGALSGWVSTLGAVVKIPPRAHPARQTEILPLPDGGSIGLDWFAGKCSASSRVVLLLPGLGNDSQTSFVEHCSAALTQAGFCAVAVNYRGVLGQLNSRRVGGMDSWKDLDAVVGHILACQPARISAVGWSMGGLILARYLGEGSALSRRISAAATLSAPLDSERQAQYLRYSWSGRVISTILGAGFALKTLFDSDIRDKLVEFGIPLSTLASIRDIFDVDRLIVCPLNGYDAVEDYYSANNPAPHIGNINVPMLVVHAVDDPVTPQHCLPLDAMKKNKNILFASTVHGGHIGWTCGHNPLGASWSDALVIRFLQLEPHKDEAAREPQKGESAQLKAEPTVHTTEHSDRDTHTSNDPDQDVNHTNRSDQDTIGAFKARLLTLQKARSKL